MATKNVEPISHDDHGGDEDDDDGEVAFATMDFGGVDFDHDEASANRKWIELEERVLFGEATIQEPQVSPSPSSPCHKLAQMVADGHYLKVLSKLPSKFQEHFCSDVADIRSSSSSSSNNNNKHDRDAKGSITEKLCRAVKKYVEESIEASLEMELIGVAALNVFLQLNYTGPSFEQTAKQSGVEGGKQNDDDDDDDTNTLLQRVHPPAFLSLPQNNSDDLHTTILAELAVDGEWPCPVCKGPYFLWLARCVLHTLSSCPVSCWYDNNESRGDGGDTVTAAATASSSTVFHLSAVVLWNARAAVAHERLLQSLVPTDTLWKEIHWCFQQALNTYCCLVMDVSKSSEEETSCVVGRKRAAIVALELGLAQHHLERPTKGKLMFHKAKDYSGLSMNVTGAMGKRTKFQQKATAQYLVQAESRQTNNHSGHDDKNNTTNDATTAPSQVEKLEDDIRLERIAFEEEDKNEIKPLTVLDQAIVLAFCLDVKNNNPADGLTGEEMGAYLARVLDHHDDWMVYSTALLERAWLEFESTHGRERALLQLQALLDQHTSRLTLTQSTFDSVESSAPAQDRLCNLHSIVYPPRWVLQRDIAERYAKLGIVTSAAELFVEIELWDHAVDCFKRAGKQQRAKEIVQERLQHQPTPRMWAALGDLTDEPEHYYKAIELSNGKYSHAFVALGHYHFEKGQLLEAAEFYQKAVKVRPLSPAIWFRLGTVSMQLGNWETALQAFSEVVQQEPEEFDAWANVASIHMHNKQPQEAYPALNESLKYNRNNWRVWVNKLYTCIDLEKYDEAVQACQTLLDMASTRDEVPELEEKCVKAIVGGVLRRFQEIQQNDNNNNVDDDKDDKKNKQVMLDSARRSLTRVHELLSRLSAGSQTKAWVWETCAYFNARIGKDRQELVGNLMKEYRALMQSGWERDEFQVKKVIHVVAQIAELHKQENTKASLSKSRFLIKNVMEQIESVYIDPSKVPEETNRLKSLQAEAEEALRTLNS